MPRMRTCAAWHPPKERFSRPNFLSLSVTFMFGDVARLVDIERRRPRGYLHREP